MLSTSPHSRSHPGLEEVTVTLHDNCHIISALYHKYSPKNNQHQSLLHHLWEETLWHPSTYKPRHPGSDRLLTTAHHQWPLLPNFLVQTLIISDVHTRSATQITVGSQRDILQAVSRFFLRPDEYSGLELRISISINSTPNLDDSKQRQVREALEYVFSVLIHYIKKKKKLARFNIIDHCWYGVQWWSRLLKSKDFKLTNHIPGWETLFCLKMHTGWRPNTFISIQVSP